MGNLDNPQVVISTSLGKMIFKLYPEVAPVTVENFLELARSQLFEENPSWVYRVIPGFVAQGGPLGGNDEQLNSAFIKGEFGSIKHERGVISMARSSDPDSANCHFFICLATLERLDGQYASFGRLISGEKVLAAIEDVERTDGVDGKLSRPVPPVRILRVEEL